MSQQAQAIIPNIRAVPNDQAIVNENVQVNERVVVANLPTTYNEGGSNKIIVAVRGKAGQGKTTLINRLREYLLLAKFPIVVEFFECGLSVNVQHCDILIDLTPTVHIGRFQANLNSKNTTNGQFSDIHVIVNDLTTSRWFSYLCKYMTHKFAGINE
jgi:hypothetical protein